DRGSGEVRSVSWIHGLVGDDAQPFTATCPFENALRKAEPVVARGSSEQSRRPDDQSVRHDHRDQLLAFELRLRIDAQWTDLIGLAVRTIERAAEDEIG